MYDAREAAVIRITRRRFLKTTSVTSLTLGAAASVFAPFARGAQRPPGATERWQMRLSTSSIHFLHLPIEQACARIADLGFPAIDIWSSHAGCPHLDDIADRLGAEGLQKLLEETKLKLCSFSVYQGGYPKYAKLMGDVGGGVAIRGSTRPCKPSELVGRIRKFLEALKPEVELAEEQNSFLAIENHGNALVDSIDSLKAFVDWNRSPRLGIALAPYHLQVLGASVEEAISVCDRQLFYFYAWQRAEGIEQLPGHGSTDFRPWIHALAKIRYRGYVNPFVHGDIDANAMSQALGKSRDYLEQCYRNEERISEPGDPVP